MPITTDKEITTENSGLHWQQCDYVKQAQGVWCLDCSADSGEDQQGQGKLLATTCSGPFKIAQVKWLHERGTKSKGSGAKGHRVVYVRLEAEGKD